MKSRINILGGIFLLASLANPVSGFASAGFNGAALTPVNQLVCSGHQDTITFTPSTCISGAPTDWSATYFIDSSHDGGSTWYTPTGVVTGTINNASGPLVYTSPVINAPTTCDLIYYRVRLTGLSNSCTAATTFTSLTVNASVCPQPAPITGPVPPNVCVGHTISLSDVTASGTWSSSAPITIASVSSTGLVTGIGAGTSVVYYKLSGGCASTDTVTVLPVPPGISGSNNVCVGSVATYTLSTATAGTWSTSNPAVGSIDPVTGTLNTASGTATGITTITFTASATSCFSVFPVTVNPIPAAIGCNVSFCAASSITLCDATPGGTWSGGAAGIAAVNASTGAVLGLGGGTAGVTYTAAGCSTNAVVTVNPLPSAILGSPFVCIGATTTLTSTPATGTWFSDMTSVATIDPASGILTGIAAGTANVSYTLPTGCFRSLVASVGPLPSAITGPDSACEGTTATLSDASSGGSWTSSNTSVATINGLGVVTAILAGTTTISYTMPSGCSITMIFTVNANPGLISGLGVICPGSIVPLSDPDGGGSWLSINPGIASVDPVTGGLTGVSGGVSGIKYTLPSGCFVVGYETVNPAPAPIMGIPNTCIGFTTPLTDATSGGVWSTSNSAIATVGTSGIVSGIGAGTVSIIYTLPTGCASSVVVTVDAIPVPIIGPFTMCLGSNITLTHPVAGGTWSTSDTFVAPVFLGTGTVVGHHVGTATITYTLASGCMVTTVVTVFPIPANITGTLYMCAGATSTLSDPTPGGTWTSNNTAVATVGSSTGLVTGVAGGTDIITYTLVPGGCFTTVNVTVYALPAIIGTPIVCVGATVPLTGVPAGGFWSSTLPIIASVGSLSGIVTGVNTGTTVITYALPTTCLTTIVVTVQPENSPTTGLNHECVGNTTTLSNATGAGTWTSSNTGIATVGSATGDVTGVSAGVVTITYTFTGTGCNSYYSFTVDPLPLAVNGPTEVCIGATIALTDPTPGGTWSSSGIFATVGSSSGIVTGVLDGVETIVYTLITTGCTTSYLVTVDPLPGAISGPGAVCLGNSISLSSATPGGIWSIAPTSVATISSTGVVTSVSAGTATVSYTVFPTGCSATTIITVNPLPVPITGQLNLCLNDSTTLYDTTFGGISLGGTWTSDNILIAVINPTTGLLGTVSAGTVTITYTLPTGCYITTVVTVNPIPQPIMGPLQVCVGSSVLLTNVTTGGSWSSSSPSVATIGSADGIVTGVIPGTTFITYTLPSSCPRVVILTVNPVPAPITGITSICLGNTTTLSTTTTGGTWSSSDYSVAIPIMTTGVVFSISVGTAIISYILPTGCFAATTLIVNPLPTASTITGSREICVNTSTTLFNPAYPGGTWFIATGQPASVTSPGPGLGVIHGDYAGIASVTYTLPTGCDTVITIKVDPLPSTIVGPDALCASGNTATYTSSPGPGVWTSSNPAVGSINASTGVLTSGVSGTTIITYTINATGCQITKVVTVNPNPAPITGLSQICLYSNTVLSSGTPGGTWSATNTHVIVTPFPTHPDSALVDGNSVGVDTVHYTLITGCSALFVVTVNPLPSIIVCTHTLCVNDSTFLIDSIAGGVWTSSNNTVATVTVLGGHVFAHTAGTVIITYTLSTGCNATFLMTINPLPPAITGLTDVCVGNTIQLYDTTATGFTVVGTWTSDSVNIATISGTGLVTGIRAGVDTILFTLPVTGCYVNSIITVHPIPAVTIVTYPSIICRKSSTTLTVTGAGAGGTYTWVPGTGLSTTTGPVVIASPTITTTYTVTGTTIYGCEDTAVVTVVVDSTLNHVMVTGRDSICKGACTQLIASGRDHTYFHWSPSVGLSCTICDTVLACPTSTTAYQAIAIDDLGCQDTVFVTVTVMPLPAVSVTPNPAFVCRGSSTQLIATDAAALAGTTTRFAWFPNAFISCDTCPNPTVSDTFNLVYRVTGITQFGCIDSIKVPVSVLDSAFNTINKDTTVCLGSSAQLYATSFNPDGSRSDFFWYGLGEFANNLVPNPVVTPYTTTTYTLVITPNHCFIDTLYTTVKVVPAPAIHLNITAPTTVASGTPIDLIATIGQDDNTVIQSYFWSHNPTQGTLSCDTCYHTIATPIATSTYTFTVTNEYGCSADTTVTITVNCDGSEVFIPNTFTPNGDGFNDRFYVSGKGISIISKMQIFNRWGELLYEAHNISPNSPSQGWDGQYKGVVLEPDVFIYIVEATCTLGSKFVYRGDVSIVR